MEAEEKMESRKRFLLNIAYWVVILAIVYLGLKYLLNLVMPFFLATVFASAVRPIARVLSSDTRWKKNGNGEKVAVKRKFRMNPTVAGIISALVLFLVLGGLLTLIVVRLVNGIAELVSAAPDFYYKTMLPVLTASLEWLESFSGRFDATIMEMMQSAVPNLISSLGSMVTNFSARVLGWISSFAGKLPSFLVSTLICLIATVFIAIDYEIILRFFRRNLPAKALKMAANVRNSFLDILRQFIKSYFIIFCITAAEIALGLTIFGVEQPLLIAVLVAVLDAFPVVGSGTVLIPWALFSFIAGNTVRGIELAVLYVVVLIVRQVIEPRIVGKHVGLRPVVTLMCMFVGTKLFSVLGLFGLPIAVAILTDLNDRGLIHLVRRPEPAESTEEIPSPQTEETDL